jgi:hypothetical protein
LLDIPLLSDGDIAYCDTDVLFLRPFRDLFRWPDDATASVFIADGREAYSVLPWHLVGPNRLQLASRVNSGLFMLRKHAYDLDFFEWCLGRAEFRQIDIWMEQTCWSALGNRVGCGMWDEGRVTVMRPHVRFEQAVAVHFSHCHRGDLPKAIEHARASSDLREPVSVATRPATACHPLALAVSQARHVGGTLKHRMLHG